MNKSEGIRTGTPVPGCPCLHVENGRTGIPKICIHGYECWHCAFNQWLEMMEEKNRGPQDWNAERYLMAKAA